MCGLEKPKEIRGGRRRDRLQGGPAQPGDFLGYVPDPSWLIGLASMRYRCQIG